MKTKVRFWTKKLPNRRVSVGLTEEGVIAARLRLLVDFKKREIRETTFAVSEDGAEALAFGLNGILEFQRSEKEAPDGDE